LDRYDLPVNVDSMRRIDRWCGVPICFALTLWRRVAGAFAGERTPAAPPRQILLIQTAEMGSLVLALPAVRHLRETYPGCGIHVLVFRHLGESVNAIGLAGGEHVITIDPSNVWTIGRDTLRFMREARRRHVDTVVNFEMFARFGAILSYLSGARRRAAFHAYGQAGLYCGDLLTHRVIYNPHVHTAEALLTIARSLDEPMTDRPMGKLPRSGDLAVGRVASDPAAARGLRDRLVAERPAIAGRRIIVINPNASQLIPIRRWPLESYAELAAAFLTDPANAVVLTGTAAEEADARFIVERIEDSERMGRDAGDRVVNLAGKTAVRDLLDLYNIADLLVTNDSGPAQLAALTSVHILVFFGPETPALYQPLAEPGRCTVMYSHYACSPCVTAFNQRRTDCSDNQCLKTIDVATVHRAAVAILDRRGAAMVVARS
jgi:ADP-heptose:LPS heptosyltransferase